MIQTFTALASGIELLADLTAAAVLLMVLDKAALAVRLTYRAGRFVGHLWFSFGVPAVLTIADWISWAVAQIDWSFAAGVFIDCLKAIAALVVAAAMQLDAAHKRWVGQIDWSRPVAPAINPLWVVSEEMQRGLTADQIRATFALKQRVAKHRLIATALAVC